jgi:hypothetical protein
MVATMTGAISKTENIGNIFNARIANAIINNVDIIFCLKESDCN